MKTKLFFLILFASFYSNAQIVNIPDANFKAGLLEGFATGIAGNNILINANGDGEIQQSEADAIYKIHIGGLNISDITGITSFSNLKELEISNCTLALVDIQNMSFLNKVVISSDITSIGTINLHNLPLLNDVAFHNAEIHNISIINTPLLQKIYIDISTNDSVFSTSVLPGLEEFKADMYFGDFIDFSKFPNLKKLYLWNIYNDNLNITGLNSLEEITLDSCPYLMNITIPDLPALKKIKFLSMFLQSLTIGSLPLLTDFNVDDSNANLPLIDLSGCPLLDKLKIWANVGFLNLKNGKSTYTSLDLNINVTAGVGYICVDEGEETIVQAENNQNTVISSYCSFTPGGSYNTITGTTIFDTDNNGCGTGDAFHGLMKVKINDGTTNGYTFTNSLSQYKFYTQAGNFTLTPEFENGWFTASPATASVNFANNNNNTSANNFCITSVGFHPDVEVVVYPIGNAQPGFDAQYKIVYKNKGNQTLSGAVTLNYDDTVLYFVSATPVQSSATTGQLTFNYANLLPFEDREMIIVLNLNGPMETPSLNNGDDLNFSVAISPTAGDETPADNTFIYEQEIVGSDDPNDIVCLQGDVVSPDEIGDYLHYVVNFENTGTAPTSFIVVRVDVNPAQYDISSLRVLNTSHASDIRVNGNRIEFIMPSAVLAAGDHGNILFKMKTKGNLTEGNMVKKKAGIYFDYNFPIVTNEANSTFQALNTGSWTKDDSITVYPNPSAGMVNIEASSAISSVELYDVQGRLLEVQKAEEMKTALDIATRAKGIYFVKVRTERGIKVEKIVRQ